MIYLSKSKYCGIWQCPKIAWLKKYKPEEFKPSGDLQDRLDAGNEVGDLAMGLFGDYVEVTAYKGDDIDISTMIANTEFELSRGTEVICEASFDYNGLYCAVDILRKNGEGWDIYEVKSSTHSDKDVYYADVAYQKYVLTHCGINVKRVFLVCVNNKYIFDGRLDINKLFIINEITDEISNEEKLIEPNIAVAERIVNCPDEPDIDISTRCCDPYDCAFWGYCARNVPSPSVFDLYRLGFDKKIKYYRAGKADYASLLGDPGIKNEKQTRQILFGLYDNGDYIEKENIREFLKTLSYPLYFLDFESVQPVIPRYIGTHPYQQIPFQYSLHYIEREGGELRHKEFLAEPEENPLRLIAERLCEDIPMNVCVTAYYKGFECSRIKELAERFPDLAEHLLNIRDNIVDLLVPFRSGWYYNRAMGGSFSIKSVLPALYPNDPGLDYHNLQEVHNGTEAQTVFESMRSMTPEQRAETRKNMLAYCGLDTYALVKVWEKLAEAAK